MAPFTLLKFTGMRQQA